MQREPKPIVDYAPVVATVFMAGSATIHRVRGSSDAVVGLIDEARESEARWVWLEVRTDEAVYSDGTYEPIAVDVDHIVAVSGPRS